MHSDSASSSGSSTTLLSHETQETPKSTAGEEISESNDAPGCPHQPAPEQLEEDANALEPPRPPSDTPRLLENEHMSDDAGVEQGSEEVEYHLVCLRKTRMDTYESWLLWSAVAYIMGCTIAYYILAAKPGSWLLRSDASLSISLVGLLSLASTMLGQALINISSDQLKWTLASREKGIEILSFLALSSATSIKNLLAFSLSLFLCRRSKPKKRWHQLIAGIR